MIEDRGERTAGIATEGADAPSGSPADRPPPVRSTAGRAGKARARTPRIGLILAGGVALNYALPIAAAIAALILIVVSSYRQTIRAYPQGGGAYIVAKDNLGVFPSLIAGGALLTDDVLTVAVSVAAGIAAVTLANLRGVRESGRIFAVPTYLFVASIIGMVAYGVAATTFGWLSEAPDHLLH